MDRLHRRNLKLNLKQCVCVCVYVCVFVGGLVGGCVYTCEPNINLPAPTVCSMLVTTGMYSYRTPDEQRCLKCVQPTNNHCPEGTMCQAL